MTYQQTLFNTAQRIFEDAAFSFVDPPEESSVPLPDDAVSAVSLLFSGPFSGILAMLTPKELSTVLAANMLGIEEDDPDAVKKGIDALGELLNMICGNLLPAIAGAQPEFKIDAPMEIPVAKFREMQAGTNGGGISTLKLFVEECEVNLVFLVTEGEAPGE